MMLTWGSLAAPRRLTEPSVACLPPFANEFMAILASRLYNPLEAQRRGEAILPNDPYSARAGRTWGLPPQMRSRLDISLAAGVVRRAWPFVGAPTRSSCAISQ